MRTQTDLEALNRSQAESERDSFTAERYRQMAEQLVAPRRILDVGCNVGRGGQVLRARFPEATIVGIDLLPDRLERIPPDLYDELITSPLQQLECAPFDGLVMGELIEHLPYEVLEEFLMASFGLLNPRGQLVLTTPNPHYLLLRWRANGSVLGGAHVSVHCPEALRQYLRHLGFKNIRTRGTGRVSQLVGARLPLLMYGSYLLHCRRD